jgi:16S rRNA (adenine1518-N6/adenine1519-N6)-dimethyltransferase
MIHAKKHLGQNFLQNKEVLHKIVKALEIKEADVIIEVGSGHGELTEFLVAEKPKKLITIEKDESLVKSLTEKFNDITIIEGDALEKLKELNITESWKLVGNIPYYITGHLLRVVSELANPPQRTVLTIQKEVAERIVAIPPKASLLSSVTRGWANPEYLLTIPRADFVPVPKVDSAVISLDRLPISLPDEYFVLARALFKQPRKKASNNLADYLKIGKKEIEAVLLSCDLPVDIRPQNIYPEHIILLSQKFSPPAE